MSTDSTAEERAGQSRWLYLEHVAEAAAVLRLCRSGVVEQPGGELNAASGEFIVHLIFKCLKTWTFASRNAADTDALFVRSPW